MTESITTQLPFLFGKKVQNEEDMEISPIKNGPSGSSYAPIVSDKFDISFDQAKKKVSRFCILAILVNAILFIYIGPTPWAHHIPFENADLGIVFICWDALIAIASTFILTMGLSKKTLSKTAELKGYKLKILILTILQALTSLFILIFVKFSVISFVSIILRIFAIALNFLVWRSARNLLAFYEQNRPTFGI